MNLQRASDGIEADLFRDAMRRLASTVTIVATGAAPQRHGMTATAVCSLTAEPAQVLVCLNAASGTCAAIRGNGRFSVNVLDADHAALAGRFAGAGHLSGDERFDDAQWCENEAGLPALERAIAVFSCELRHAWPIDTHVILIGSVSRLWLPHEAAPLVYRGGHFGTWSACLN